MKRMMPFAGLAVVAAIASGEVARKRPLRLYSEFCGPPQPMTRQQRRALERKARKVQL